MRILITGAGGFLGSALTAHLANRHEVLALPHRELDVTDAAAVQREASRSEPQVVINCAVAGVDGCERDPALAERINVEAPRLLARAANEVGAAMIHFSTNYVFDGERDAGRFYDSGDTARPINVYGQTKLRGEQAVEAECTRSTIIRTSWVFGRGATTFLSAVPGKLRAAQRITAITDRFASVTLVNDLVARVEELMMRETYGVFHANNAGVCSYAQFADAAADYLRLREEQRCQYIAYTTAADVAGSARRPRWTPMRCSHSEQLGLAPLRPWQEALRAYCLESSSSRVG